MDRDVKWFSMSIGEQISNIGSEVHRAIRWKNKNEENKMRNFVNKAIELIDRTKKDPKNIHRIEELSFCEEEIKDYFLGDNFYNTDEEQIIRYYDAFL